MSFALWLLTVLPLLGLPRTMGSASVSDSTSVFVRGELRGGTASGLDSTPRLDLGFTLRHVALTADYAPRLVLANLSGPNDVRLLVLHGGSAGLRYTNRRTQLSVGQYFSVGEQYLGTLPQLASRDALSTLDPSTSRASLLASTDALKVRSATTSFVATHQWRRRWASGFSASYALSGGADAEAVALAPRFQTLLMATSVRHDLTQHAQLQLRVSSSRVHTSLGSQYWISDATSSWNMQWTPDLTTSLTGGAAWLESRAKGSDDASARAAPTLAGSVTRQLQRRLLALKLRSGGSLAPFVNALTAALQTTMQGSVGVSLVVDQTELALGADGSRSLPWDGSSRFRVLGASARVNHAVADWLVVYTQFRLFEQRVAGSTQSLAPQWLALLGVTLAAPRLDF